MSEHVQLGEPRCAHCNMVISDCACHPKDESLPVTFRCKRLGCCKERRPNSSLCREHSGEAAECSVVEKPSCAEPGCERTMFIYSHDDARLFKDYCPRHRHEHLAADVLFQKFSPAEPQKDEVPHLPWAFDAVQQHDDVNHPAHYKTGPVEVIDIIEGWDLCAKLANVIKYILRSDHKGQKLKDLKKARWYLDRKIARMEKGAEQ